jgi:hypothetical protein
MRHPEKSKREENPRRKNWFLIIAIPLFVCGCALPYGFVKLIWGNSYTVCFGTFPSDEDLQKETFFKLPSSARNLTYDANGLGRKGGCTVWIKFEIDPEDLEALQKSTLVETFEDAQLEEGNGFSYFMQKKGWVQPKNSIAGVGYNNDYPYTSQWVFIDTTEQNNFIVYILMNQEWR